VAARKDSLSTERPGASVHWSLLAGFANITAWRSILGMLFPQSFPSDPADTTRCAREGTSMRLPIEIEDIDYLRRKEGIDDVELHEEIRGLRIGDFVRLTFVVKDKALSRETLLVRITGIRGETLRGQLADQPVLRGLLKLRLGSRIDFVADQIHSIAQAPPKPRTGKRGHP
jgi:hypothetical protein